MWDELVNFFNLTVTKEDIKRYNEIKKKKEGENIWFTKVDWYGSNRRWIIKYCPFNFEIKRVEWNTWIIIENAPS